MFGINDATVFENYEKEELQNPSPRKEMDGRIIHTSRELEFRGDLTLPVLCDFGAARWGDEVNEEYVQPELYRSPEVILGIPWSYEIDVLNVGCVVSHGRFKSTEFL